MIIPLPTILLASFIEKAPTKDSYIVHIQTVKLFGITFSYWLTYQD